MSIVESANMRFNVNTQDNCSICLEPLSDERGSLVRAACGHIFHENCFMQWRMTPKDGVAYALQEKNCSLCRGPLDTAQFIKPSSEDGTTYNVVPGAIPSVPGLEENMLNEDLPPLGLGELDQLAPLFNHILNPFFSRILDPLSSYITDRGLASLAELPLTQLEFG